MDSMHSRGVLQQQAAQIRRKIIRSVPEKMVTGRATFESANSVVQWEFRLCSVADVNWAYSVPRCCLKCVRVVVELSVCLKWECI
jgi:hypothetical protein